MLMLVTPLIRDVNVGDPLIRVAFARDTFNS